jgi:hypothetical protein
MLRTTILSPSATSLRSLAAFTRERTRNVSKRCSKSPMADIHGSLTSVSRMRVASVGGIVTSDSRLESGFSIRWADLNTRASTARIMRNSPVGLLACCQYPYFCPAILIFVQRQPRGLSEMSTKMTLESLTGLHSSTDGPMKRLTFTRSNPGSYLDSVMKFHKLLGASTVLRVMVSVKSGVRGFAPTHKTACRSRCLRWFRR